jgi:hypothetical protein
MSDPESWKLRACTLANRTLTPEEWEKFLPGLPYEPACARPESLAHGQVDHVTLCIMRATLFRRSCAREDSNPQPSDP